MKLFLLVILFFGGPKVSMAQYEYGLGNDKDLIKTTKVKALSIYYFNSTFDSLITHLNTFDSLGNPVSVTMYGNDGRIALRDTFIYNDQHLLVKKVSANGIKKINESIFTYTIDGKMQRQLLMGDSVNLEVVNTYDEGGHIIKSMDYNSSWDTTTTNNFYNSKGLLIKSITQSKRNGTLVFSYSYNTKGKKTHQESIYPDSKYSFVFKYDDNGKNYQITTTITSGKIKEYNKVLYSFYPNGLTSAKILFANGKPINEEKTFYTYY